MRQGCASFPLIASGLCCIFLCYTWISKNQIKLIKLEKPNRKKNQLKF